MEIELKQIIEYINEDIIECFGDVSPVKIKYIKEPAFVDEYSLDWVNISKSEKQSIAENSKAKVVICDPDIKYSHSIKEQDKVLIHVLNPRLVISKIGSNFFLQSPSAEIHPTSTIHPKATIGTNVYIGPNVVLGNCKIGDNCVLYGNNYIFDNVVLEHNVVINPGTVIGVPGLGCERTEDKKLVSFPHLGGVIIKEHVEIGANCQIARGAFSNTIINSGTKINGLCFIAHNCNIGKNVFITGSSMLAGSVSIGDNTTIYSKVIIREHVKVGSSSIIGMGAVVTKHVPDGETWIGSPAKKITK